MPNEMIAFGPVPSRRLGRSLGINNIPPKICPYSCIYCQLGRTNQESVDRKPFYELDVVLEEVRAKVAASRQAGESIDYLSFVPDGEPTLVGPRRVAGGREHRTRSRYSTGGRGRLNRDRAVDFELVMTQKVTGLRYKDTSNRVT